MRYGLLLILVVHPALARMPVGNAALDTAMQICDANVSAPIAWPPPWAACNAVLAQWTAAAAALIPAPAPPTAAQIAANQALVATTAAAAGH